MTGSRTSLRNVEDLVGKDWKTARCVVAEMVHFISQLQYYILFEVIEASWNELNEAIHKPDATLDDLIEALLALSQVSRQPLQRNDVNLADVVAQVQDELQPDLAGREVWWEVAPLPTVTGDEGTLRQVMMNLLSNAVKYSRLQGTAVIRVWAEDRPQEWAIFVHDNGVGFDETYADKLFGVFKRLHRADEFEGTGVGLANVRRIIQRHGGEVMASSRPGEGATLGFTLPKSL